jgi:endonuclease YncB( thermonuclease family)
LGFAAILGLVATCGAATAAENTDSCALSAPERHLVAEVKDGETLALTDGTVVRLIGAKAPAAPLSYRGAQPWPLVAEAKAALSELAQGAEVELRFGGTRADRHGRSLAQVYAVKGEKRVWLQAELVGRGLARVYSFPDNHACLGTLLAREAEARAKRLGVWSVSAYRIVEAENVERLSRLTRSYQLVEGVVAAVGEGRTNLYLNFAEDWRSDFTVALTRKDAETFKAEGLDLTNLAGKRLRVRGWLTWRNGPMIEVTHVGQIELLPGGLDQASPKPEQRARSGVAL